MSVCGNCSLQFEFVEVALRLLLFALFGGGWFYFISIYWLAFLFWSGKNVY